jgi:hypothetical protein
LSLPRSALLLFLHLYLLPWLIPSIWIPSISVPHPFTSNIQSSLFIPV